MTLLYLDSAKAADRSPDGEHKFNNAIAVGVSGNRGSQDSNGVGLNAFEYARRIHGHWFASVGLGLDRTWTETGAGTEQIETKSLTAQLSYSLKHMDFFELQVGVAVFGSVSQDFSSYNLATGLYDQDLGTSVAGGVSFGAPITNRWAAYITPQVVYDLNSTDFAFETEIGLAYAF